MANTTPYLIAVLVIFIILSLPTFFILWRHGKRGSAYLGWGYLLLFCSLKVISSGLGLADSQSPGSIVVSSIGLSPLLLSLAGILHEARFYHGIPENRHSSHREKRLTTLHHSLTMLGVVLVAIGMSKLAGNTSEDVVAQGWKLAKVGGVILFLSWLSLAAATTLSAFAGYLRIDSHPQKNVSRLLLIGVLVSLPLVGVRVIATLAYLVTQERSLSAVTGSIGVRIGLYLFEEVAATLILIFAGICTRDVRKLPEDAEVLDASVLREAVDVGQSFQRK
ncbi:uncharacterized protein CTRU02_204840 [Colletotrichum truncatum]|uniref:Uncharacterized protein n=1 Tax=Colletotrichum truncatum TaxID=5467 RepID=A0ACC3ZD82_COLTU|nr:uncharacterized protein CTRU02_03075 [Colletotrichum truncatum]KAF6798033.1 hypothetical protein CTRU02_03075 [Colletotrichum truncatum]